MSIYGYSRLSDDNGPASVSIESQQAEIDRYAARRWPSESVEYTADNDVSGGVPLIKRPGGASLMDRLQCGDHLIAAKVDRLFRSVLDGADVIVTLERRGVSLHLLDLQIDTSTPMGRAMAHVAIVFAELERERIGERRRAAAAHRRRQGIPTMDPRYAPLGWRIETTESGRVFVPNHAERETCQMILRLRRQGVYCRVIVERLDQDRTPRRDNRPWTMSAVRRATIAARDGFPLISEDCRRWGSQSRS